MFVCNDCHDKRCPMEFAEDFMRSYGKCEGCGKGAACYDCHGYKSLPPKPLPQTVVHQRAGSKALCSAEPGVNWRDAYDAFAPDDLPDTVTCVKCRDMLHVDANEHLAWCKERALAYVERGDLENAFASMASDMSKDPATRGHAGLQLGALLLINGHLDTPRQMREWIEGFN